MLADKTLIIKGRSLFKNNFFSSGYFGNLSMNSSTFLLPYEEKMNIAINNSIFYEFNNLGFRCDDFKKHHDGKHILFSGCSETEGAANALEDCWANILYNKIKNDIKTSGYYNVGKTGLTVSLCVLNVFQYINDYGNPDYIFLQLPDQTRFLSWSKESGLYPIYLNRITFKGELSHFFSKDKKSSESEINIFFDRFLLKTLIQFCKNNSIKIFWSTWSDNNILNSFEDLPNFVSTIPLNKEKLNIKIEDLIARDGYHYGKGFHSVWAEKFYKELLNDKDYKKNITSEKN